MLDFKINGVQDKAVISSWTKLETVGLSGMELALLAKVSSEEVFAAR
jgi:hypothetical protein